MDDASRTIAAEAAVTAVLEPPRRRLFSRRRKEQREIRQCENCGSDLTGPFCAKCGQHAVDYRRSFGRVFADALDSFLNWDSKFFATIGWLLARPWKLTIDFLAGKRVRYVHPLRLYLLVSIVFFFVVNHWAKGIRAEPGRLRPKDRAEIQAKLKRKELPPEVRQELEALASESSPTPAAVTSAPAVTPPPTPESTAPPPSAPPLAPSSTSPPPETRDFGPFVQFDKPPTDNVGKWLERRAKEKMGEHGSKMGLFIATLFSNLPYMMLCCIPLFAFVLKVLYLRRRIFYIDHLIYALHIHAFFYAGVMLIVFMTLGLHRIMPRALAGWLIAAVWIAFTVQIFLSIRRVYQQNWFVSVLKFLTGAFAYLIVLCVALGVTFFATLLMPS